ncbi:MAG: hypothetical protein AAF597_07215, partial [Bacteroidota bacterium]
MTISGLHAQHYATSPEEAFELLTYTDSLPALQKALWGIMEMVQGETIDNGLEVALKTQKLTATMQLDNDLRATVLGSMAKAYAAVNQFDSAIYYMELTHPLMPVCRGEECWNNFWTYGNLYDWYGFEERYQDAIYLADSITSIEGIDRESQSISITARANAFKELGDYENALTDLRFGLDLIEEDAPPEIQSDMMRQVSELYGYLGQWTSAETWAKRAMAKARLAFQFDSMTILKSAHHYSQLLCQQGRAADGLRLLNEIYTSTLSAEGFGTSDWRQIAATGLLACHLENTESSPAELKQQATQLMDALQRENDFDNQRVKISMLKVLADYYAFIGEDSLAVQYARDQLKYARQATKVSSEIIRSALEHLHQIERKAGQPEAAYSTLTELRTYEKELRAKTQSTALARASVS